MVIIVRLFGIAIMGMGIFFLVSPEGFKQYISFWRDKKKIQAGGILAILIGVLFLVAASQCKISWLITVLGIWSIIKGVLLLALGQEKLNVYFDWWLNKPAYITRFISIFAVALGLLFIYSA